MTCCWISKRTAVQSVINHTPVVIFVVLSLDINTWSYCDSQKRNFWCLGKRFEIDFRIAENTSFLMIWKIFYSALTLSEHPHITQCIGTNSARIAYPDYPNVFMLRVKSCSQCKWGLHIKMHLLSDQRIWLLNGKACSGALSLLWGEIKLFSL